MPICIDFDALKQENNDIIGWIYCPDTPINYPVVKGKDNNQYLRADLKGKYLVSGTIFADYRNNEVGEDKNYIVYGHNMKTSTMFGTLVKYKDQTYYDSHPILYFLTPERNYIIELIAGAVVKRDSDIYQTAPADNTIADIMIKSTFNSTVEIGKGENIITLSTCSYEFNNARYVVVGKLKKI
jgi:sortase B